MRKIAKPLVAVLLLAVLSMTSITSFASEQAVSPRLSHANGANFSFAATANGGYVDVTYYGYDSFVRADLNVKIEKRFLFVFWNDVCEWSATSNEIDGQFINKFDLDGSGTYRATFTLTITGNDGTVDTIPIEIEDSY